MDPDQQAPAPEEPEAIVELRQRLARKPSAGAHAKLGWGLVQAGRGEEGLPHLRRATELAPADVVYWNRLAQALNMAGDREAALAAWRRLLQLKPDDQDAHRSAAAILLSLGKAGAAVEHARALGSVAAGGEPAAVLINDKTFYFEQDGKLRRADYAYYRGEHTNFTPRDKSLERPRALAAYFAHGLVPEAPPLARDSWIVAFGSCFAAHISDYLDRLGFNVATRRDQGAYVSNMGDGIVNTYAIRQQFEWAWLGKTPAVDLWHGYDARVLGYDEEVRLATKALFDRADAFIITLGLSEVWYDEPSGEVFWRAVPRQVHDPARHKFRVVRHSENLANIAAIYDLIRRHRPEALIVFTLSPIPLAATFRPMACTAADSASKAHLRSALDEFLSDHGEDRRLFYFPSYEIAQRAFDRPYQSDRRHVRRHVLDLNMAVFERYFCQTGLTDADLDQRYRQAREQDARLGEPGQGGTSDISEADAD